MLVIYRLQRYPRQHAGRTTGTQMCDVYQRSQNIGGLGGLVHVCVVLLDGTKRSGVQVTTPAHHRWVGGQTV